MITERDLLPAAGVLLGGILATVGGLALPSLLTGPQTSTAVPMEVSRALACPSAPLGETGARALANASSADEVAADLASGDPAAPARILPAAEHQPVGGVWLSGSPRGNLAWWGQCLPGTSDQFIQLANPATAKILLVNPGTVDAQLDLTLYGTEGTVQAIGTSAITVPAGRQVMVPISVQAPARKPVGARIIASQGRVAAWALVDDGGGADYLPSARALTESVLSAIPMGGDNRVLLTNPSEQRATVRMVAHSKRGAFDPAEAGQTVVEPMSTTMVDLSRSFAGEAGSLSITSDQPVAATLWSGANKDLAFAAAQSAAGQGELLLPTAGTVLFTNPQSSDQSITVTQPGAASRDWTVPAGGVVSIDIPKGPGLVRFIGSGITAGALLSSPGSAISSAQPGGLTQGVPRPRQDPSLR